MMEILKAVIFDIDDTLANYDHRRHYLDGLTVQDRDKFYSEMINDVPIEWCTELIKSCVLGGYNIVFLTCRSEKDRFITEKWLREHVPYATEPNLHLYMRKKDDPRLNFEVKRDIYYQQIWPQFQVLFVVDDSISICNMFRAIGVPALNCADPEGDDLDFYLDKMDV